MSRTGVGQVIRIPTSTGGGTTHGFGLRLQVPGGTTPSGADDDSTANAVDPDWGDWDTDGYYDSGTELPTIPTGLGGVYWLALDLLLGVTNIPTSGFVSITYDTPLSAPMNFRLNFNQFTGGVGNRGAHGFMGASTILVPGDTIVVNISNSTNEEMTVTEQYFRLTGWLLVPA